MPARSGDQHQPGPAPHCLRRSARGVRHRRRNQRDGSGESLSNIGKDRARAGRGERWDGAAQTLCSVALVLDVGVGHSSRGGASPQMVVFERESLQDEKNTTGTRTRTRSTMVDWYETIVTSSTAFSRATRPSCHAPDDPDGNGTIAQGRTVWHLGTNSSATWTTPAAATKRRPPGRQRSDHPMLCSWRTHGACALRPGRRVDLMRGAA